MFNNLYYRPRNSPNEKESPVKKIFSVIVFAIVAICVIAPKFIAPKFQDQVTAFIDQINKTPGYIAYIESTDSSWFGSKNIISVGLDLGLYEPSLSNENIEVKFVLDTQYGPLLFADQGIVGLFKTNLQIAGAEQRDLLIWDDTKPLYQLAAVSGFDGEIKFKDSVPAFTDIEKILTFSGYNGEGKIGSDALSYEGLLAQLSLDDSDQPVKAENITLSMQIETDLETMIKGGFYDSKANISIETFTVGKDISASGLAMSVEMALDEETQLGTIEVGYLAKEFAYDEYQVSDLTLMTELAKFSNQFFLDYTSFSQGLADKNYAPEDFLTEQLSFFGDNLEELFSHQPEFNITDFSGSFPEGSFNANLTSKLDDSYIPTLEELLIPEFWVYNALVNANIEVDDKLIRNLAERFLAKKMNTSIDSPDVKQQVELFINHFEQQGFFLHKDDQYVSEISIEGGEAYINGQFVPLI